MRLSIYKKYFDDIKANKKRFEFRDAHITFECIETGETLRKEVISTKIVNRQIEIPDILEDLKLIEFELADDGLNNSQKETDEQFNKKMQGNEPRKFRNYRKCKGKLKGTVEKGVGICEACYILDSRHT